jgi:mono/diheme cytochrome c family protein
MMARHHAVVPEPYAGLANPIAADEESLTRGQRIYTESCATCHGDGGMGDGPSGVSLEPAPALLAHTSAMLGDDYLFWRTSEGGAEFGSTMPAWKDTLDDEAIWDVINYVRGLGSGQVIPRQGVGGATYDPAAERAKHEEMLAQGIELGVISQDEADLFTLVHDAMDQVVAAGGVEISGGMDRGRDAILAHLVQTGEISQAQADSFVDIHDRLVEAGLMQ